MTTWRVFWAHRWAQMATSDDVTTNNNTLQTIGATVGWTKPLRAYVASANNHASNTDSQCGDEAGMQ